MHSSATTRFAVFCCLVVSISCHCYDLLLPQCQGIGYKRTIIAPKEQVKTIAPRLDLYFKLLEKTTSPVFLTYLCLTMVPSCEETSVSSSGIKPCSEACHRIKLRVTPILAGRVEWGKEFHCAHLAASTNDERVMCLSYTQLKQMSYEQDSSLIKGKAVYHPPEQPRQAILFSSEGDASVTSEHIASLEKSIIHLSSVISQLTSSFSELSQAISHSNSAHDQNEFELIERENGNSATTTTSTTTSSTTTTTSPTTTTTTPTTTTTTPTTTTPTTTTTATTTLPTIPTTDFSSGWSDDEDCEEGSGAESGSGDITFY